MNWLHTARPLALGAGLLMAAAGTQAGVLDFLFGESKPKPAVAAPAEPGRKSWTIGQFSEVRVVAAEPGAAPSAHPATVSAARLTELLANVRAQTGGPGELLFGTDEIEDLAEPLSQALANAGPREDVVLHSSARRGKGVLLLPMAVTARMFVVDGRLQLIVREMRQDFYGNYRGTGRVPEFAYGSRGAASAASITVGTAPGRRADWIELALAPGAAAPAAAAAPVAPAPAAAGTAAGAAAGTAAAVAVPAAAAAAAAAPTAAVPRAAPRDNAYFEEQEQRLVTLKRLRDRGLISEEEYQQKRREVLQGL